MTSNEVDLIEKLIVLWIVRSQQQGEKYRSDEARDVRQTIEDIKKQLCKDPKEYII